MLNESWGITREMEIKTEFNLFCAKTMGYDSEVTTWFNTEEPGVCSLRVVVDSMLYDPYNNMDSLVPVVDKLMSSSTHKPYFDGRNQIVESFRQYISDTMERTKAKEVAYKQEFNYLCSRIHKAAGGSILGLVNPYENLEELIQVVEITVSRSGQSLRLEGGREGQQLDMKKEMIRYVMTCGTMVIEENNRHILDEETQVC